MSWPPGTKPLTPAQRVAQLHKAADAKRGVKTSRAPRKTMEWDFQEQLVAELRVLTLAPARFWFVPNGGNLSKAQRGRFKAMGLTAGVHDLHFAWRREWPKSDMAGRQYLLGPYGPLFGTLECKAGKGEASEEQIQFARDLEAMGHQWAVAHADDGVDGALATLRSWGFPLRSTR